jgi:hypothetical protein
VNWQFALTMDLWWVRVVSITDFMVCRNDLFHSNERLHLVPVKAQSIDVQHFPSNIAAHEMHTLDTLRNETLQNGYREWDRRLCSLLTEPWCLGYIDLLFRPESLHHVI